MELLTEGVGRITRWMKGSHFHEDLTKIHEHLTMQNCDSGILSQEESERSHVLYGRPVRAVLGR